MITIEVAIGNQGSEEEWVETLDVTSWETAEVEAKQIVAEYNEVECNRYGQTARLRELRAVVKLLAQLHDWGKVNLVTNADMTDTWRCHSCGLITHTLVGRPKPNWGGYCKLGGLK
jgi:hypothetical protein